MANTVRVGITATDEGFKSTLNQMEQSSNKFASSLSKGGKQASTFNGQLRSLRKEAVELAYAYEQLDEQAKNSDFGQSMKAQLQEVLNTAGQMQDIKGDVAEQIKNIASDTMMWDGMKEGIGVVSSGLQGLASIYGMLGGDTKEFAKALVAVNAVQSVSNTIIGIGNALQKQSALMTMLRTVRAKMFTTAQTAENAAVNAGTLAQIKLNLAVLANPYVAAAAAIAGLCAAIYIWANANDDLSESERQKAEALQSMSDELENTSDDVGKQIAAFKTLQFEYQKADGDLATMKSQMTNFDEVCKAANLTLKKQSDAEVVLNKLAPLMIKKYQLEARAAAASAAAAAEYGKILAKVAEIQKRVAAGETIDEGDLKALNLDPNKVRSMFQREAGLDDMFASVFQPSAQDLKYIGTDLEKDMQALATQAIDAFDSKFKLFANMHNEAQKELADIAKEFEANGVDLSKVYNAKGVKDATTKAAKHVKNTSKEVNTLMSTIEGCDNVIKKAQQDLTKLDHKSSNFLEMFVKLNALILSAKESKFELIDRSTLQGMRDAKSLAEDILQYQEIGTEGYEKWNTEISKLNESMYEYLNNIAKSGSQKALKNVQSQIEEIITNLPEGSAELRKWTSLWREMHEQITRNDQAIDNLKNGIQEGSVTQIEQMIATLQKEIDNLDLTVDGNLQIQWNKQEEIRQLQKKLGEQRELANGVTVEQDVKIDVTFDYKKTKLEKIERDIQQYEKLLSDLSDVKEEDVSAETWDKLQEKIQSTRDKLVELKKEARLTEVNEDLKTAGKELSNLSWEGFKGLNDNLGGIYDSVLKIGEAFENTEDPIKSFFQAFDAINSIVDNILDLISLYEEINTALTAFNAVKATSNALDEQGSAAIIKQTAALGASTTAVTAEGAAETAAAAEKQVASEANKNLAISALDLAAANIAAAHSEIPFVGPALAAAGIATVMAAVAAAHGTMMGLQTFAEGGIVGGSTTIGDRVLVAANKGEMYINTRQQKALFDFINGTMNTTQEISTPTVTTMRIKGADLYASLTNYGKITGKKLY